MRRQPKNQSKEKVRGIFTHNQGNPPIQQWIRESKKLLIKNDKAKILGDKIQIGWRQPKNLKRMVCGPNKGGSKKFSTAENPGCWKCGNCKVACPILTEGSTFSSTNTKKTYQTKQHLDCNSQFVIYLATCQRCKGQYVGKSQTPFKRRHSNHKQEIKRCYGGLGHHYGGQGCGYASVSIQLIEQVQIGDAEALATQEVYWQNQLRCYVQNGGHAHCYRKEKNPKQ